MEKTVEDLTWETFRPDDFPCMHPDCPAQATKWVCLGNGDGTAMNLCLCESCSKRSADELLEVFNGTHTGTVDNLERAIRA